LAPAKREAETKRKQRGGEGKIGAGALFGTLRFRAELDVEANQSRVAEVAVPVIPP
jgi:hypothetical protein